MYNQMNGIVLDEKTNVQSRRIYYLARLAETKTKVKIVFDRQEVTKNDDDIEMALLSDFMDVVEFDKSTFEITNRDLLVAMVELNRYRPAMEKKEIEDLINIKFPEYETSDMVADKTETVHIDSVIADFMRRYVKLKHKYLFEVAPSMMRYEACYLVHYIDNLDNIEKLCLATSEDSVRTQLRNRTLTFYDGGKKLKSILGLPMNIVEKIKEYDGSAIHHFQNYIKNGIGNVDEIETMFAWLDGIKKLNRKRKLKVNVVIGDDTLHLIGAILDQGCSITGIINSVTREMMLYDTVECFEMSAAIRNIRDTIAMQRTIGLTNTYINQNLTKWHETNAQNCKILQERRTEEFSAAVAEINKYSCILDGYLIKCPETEDELFDLANHHRNCLCTYRDLIIDKGAIIYAMYPVDDENNVVTNIAPFVFEVDKHINFVQIKTFNDMDVEDEEVIAIARKWRLNTKRKKGAETNG